MTPLDRHKEIDAAYNILVENYINFSGVNKMWESAQLSEFISRKKWFLGRDKK